MDRLDLRHNHSGSVQSEVSALDLERNYFNQLPLSSPPPLQTFASGCQVAESNAAYFSWPCHLDAAEDWAHYFGNLQKGFLPETLGRLPTGQRATTLVEVMTIKAFHSKNLRRFSLGTAIGFRIRQGALTDIPAILVFVARKVHRQLLVRKHMEPWMQLLKLTGNRQVGFLTNRHVAVDLDYPSQKMFHPLPPSLGPGVYLGAVERATPFITDDLWYGIFAGTNPETFVRADGAFIPFAEDFDMLNVMTSVKGIGEIGDVNKIDLRSPVGSVIGRQVMKVGRSSGLTTGNIMAYALEYNDEKGICFFTDFLVVGENQQTFDLEGDSGSLILLTNPDGEKPRPIGIIWGGTANRGRLKLKIGQPPEDWTSGVDLGRLLDLLELDLITCNKSLQVALQEQMNASAAGIGSAVGESSPAERIQMKDKSDENFEPINLNFRQSSINTFTFKMEIKQLPALSISLSQVSLGIEHGNRELKRLSVMGGSDDEMYVALQLGEQCESKR
ncbi:unnamed protein product [Withania somnifera]